MAKRKSGARKFGRDVSVIVIAGVISGALALALYTRRKSAPDDSNGLPSREEIRDRLIVYGPEEWGLTPGPQAPPIAQMLGEAPPQWLYPIVGPRIINPAFVEWVGPIGQEESF